MSVLRPQHSARWHADYEARIKCLHCFVKEKREFGRFSYHVYHSSKATATPTLCWVFQMLQAAHLTVLAGETYISNLTQERQRILRFLSPQCRKYYLLI